jgi:hypothetical protein
MSDHYWNSDKGVFEQSYFTDIVWRNLMLEGYTYQSVGSPAHYENTNLWNTSIGDNLVHNQKMSAEYYRAARKVMGIE